MQGDDPRDLCYGRRTTAYADDDTIIMSDEKQVPLVEDAIKRYKAVKGGKVKQEKSVNLLLVTWRGRLMSLNSVIGC